MPLNLGNTMFARWYNQQIAERQAAQANEVRNAAFLEEGMQHREEQQAKNDANLEAQAFTAGKQAETLGQPAPDLEGTTPGMAVAAQQGGQAATIEQLLAARAARIKQAELEQKQAGALELEGVKQGGAIQREGMSNAGALEKQAAADRANAQRTSETNATRIKVAEIGANKPSARMSVSERNAAASASDMRNVIAQLKAMRPNGDFTDLLTTGNQLRAKGADTAQKWGVGGLAPDKWAAMNVDQQKFEKLTGLLNIEEVHKYFGGALTPQEMRRADQAILNARMSPQGFKAALEVIEDLMARVEARGGSMSTSISLGGSAVPQSMIRGSPTTSAPAGEVTLIGPNGEKGTAPGGPELEQFLRANPGWRAQ